MLTETTSCLNKLDDNLTKPSMVVELGEKKPITTLGHRHGDDRSVTLYKAWYSTGHLLSWTRSTIITYSLDLSLFLLDNWRYLTPVQKKSGNPWLPLFFQTGIRYRLSGDSESRRNYKISTNHCRRRGAQSPWQENRKDWSKPTHTESFSWLSRTKLNLLWHSRTESCNSISLTLVAKYYWLTRMPLSFKPWA